MITWIVIAIRSHLIMEFCERLQKNSEYFPFHWDLVGSRLPTDIETSKRCAPTTKEECTHERFTGITVVLFIRKHVTKVFHVDTKRESEKKRESETKGKGQTLLEKREVRISSVLLNLCKCATYSIQDRHTRAAFISGPRCGCTRRVGSICIPPREEDIVWIVSTRARLYGNKFPWEYRGNRGYFIPFCIDLLSYIAIVRH